MTSDPASDVQAQARTAHQHQTTQQLKPQTRSRHVVPNDGTSSEATAAFIRRTLCAHHSGTVKDRTSPCPIEDLLPPLTSSNEVDLQLYALIAIIIRELVWTWYAKITPDHDFVDEIIRIIAHCTRELEQRVRKVDLEALLLDEIPALVLAHITAYRTSHRPLHPPPLALDPRQAYHILLPHPALSPVPDSADPETVKRQEENESAYRQLLVQGMLALLLPTEDLENGCLRTLVGDVLGDMILGNWIGRIACEGRVWWDGIAKLAETVHERRRGPATAAAAAAAAAKGTKSQELLWNVLNYAFLIVTFLRMALVTLFTSSSLPTRSATSSSFSSRASSKPRQKRPILNMRIWTLVSSLLDLSARMPWLEGLLQLFRHGLIAGPGRVGDTDGIIDRILSHHLSHPLTTPASYLPSVLQTLRATIFPHNSLRRPSSSSFSPSAPSPSPPPSAAAAETSRSHCAASILHLIPATVRRIYLAENEAEQRKLVERGLDVFGDAYLNKHIVFAVMECLVVKIMPELAVESVQGLVRGRIGVELEEEEDVVGGE
ncbi:MAG: hypothetical protein M1816_003493 [Peltula sp. TS41687]|nr:MAG: hypothetical protein M1816_003493 [Peltula sp. TS41687]